MWVCRPGKKGKYINLFRDTSSIYLSWEDFNYDLSKCEDRAKIKSVIKDFMQSDNRTSISNWSGQAYVFCNEIEIGDYVLVPYGRKYLLGRVSGGYEYINNLNTDLHHKRKINILKDNIPKDIFDQSTQYSLGAFRTIFKVKDEQRILDIINSENGV